MSNIKAIEDLINGYATSEDSSFLLPNVTEDFLAVRPSGNPISAKGLVGMFDSKDLVAESSELIKTHKIEICDDFAYAVFTLNEVFKGRYHEQPKVTSFPNDKNLDEIYTVGPISVRSACSRHLVPILGECWIGIKPGNKVIGLSKFARVADWVFSRPHIQEEAVMILADEIEKLCEPKGLGIIVKAQHYCMKWRGVKEPNTSMINSVVRGDFRHDLSLKQEFFELVKQQSATNNY